MQKALGKSGFSYMRSMSYYEYLLLTQRHDRLEDVGTVFISMSILHLALLSLRHISFGYAGDGL